MKRDWQKNELFFSFSLNLQKRKICKCRHSVFPCRNVATSMSFMPSVNPAYNCFEQIKCHRHFHWPLIDWCVISCFSLYPLETLSRNRPNAKVSADRYEREGFDGFPELHGLTNYTRSRCGQIFLLGPSQWNQLCSWFMFIAVPHISSVCTDSDESSLTKWRPADEGSQLLTDTQASYFRCHFLSGMKYRTHFCRIRANLLNFRRTFSVCWCSLMWFIRLLDTS